MTIDKNASAPFDGSSDVDLIITTTADDSSKIHFFLSIPLLSIASPYFREIQERRANSIPAGTKKRSAKALEPERWIVEEPTDVIEFLLRFVYPVQDPKLEYHEDVGAVYEAAVKYRFDFVVDKIREILVSPKFMEEPVRVYAMARRYGLNKEANLAARASMAEKAEWPRYDELNHITGGEFHQLLQLHRDRAKAAVKLLNTYISPTKRDQTLCYPCCQKKRESIWWDSYVKKAVELLKETPVSDVICNAELLMQVCLDPTNAKCLGCLEKARVALKPGGLIESLRHKIDELPADVV
ncbi:hypothetical protein K474DRAFT_1649836 [Panus rudis PR-1116 ss-1]|nr:hypothetical protein K474DRAFT_1649836 [Panus rudis PR-1116 ss-1]